MAKTTWGRRALVAGPVCMMAYGLIRLIDPEHNPGIDWSAGHLALLAGVVLFGPVLLRLRRMAARSGGAHRVVADAGAALGLLGAATVAIQAGIDLVVGFCSADKGAMQELFRLVQSYPGVKPVIYTVVPLFLYIGLLSLVLQLVVIKRAAVWQVVAIVAGVAVMAASLNLLALGGLFFFAALIPFRREREPQGKPGAGSGLAAGTEIGTGSGSGSATAGRPLSLVSSTTR
ncbi:hypothetical protein [Streptomyces sp. MST-110588]|uniref:hypothetical protein n=1 Tax=Streptomyces sp. MST-110588 TaxID=2833628 RepID=UPI001F5D172B|nr:hypothetical protein [Streptomyces sp. MST-110588]UNO40893.1 hypothetical protein KGS77_16555 [Streptomyces sp. MST-110588]